MSVSCSQPKKKKPVPATKADSSSNSKNSNTGEAAGGVVLQRVVDAHRWAVQGRVWRPKVGRGLKKSSLQV